MRRSVREAIVGFSLLAALAGGDGFWFWLRGVSLGQSQWRVRLQLDDASGLAPRSAVTYRGVLVGTVQSVVATSESVVAVLEITNPSLRLPRPVSAQVQSGSLLGADAQVALLGSTKVLPADLAGPLSDRCDNRRIVCADSVIVGRTAPSLSTVTDLVQRMLEDADRGRLVPTVTSAAQKFETTASEATVFLKQAQGLVHKLDRAGGNVEAATAHIRHVTAEIDNPTTVRQLKQTVANAEELTARWKAVGGDVNRLTSDPTFMAGVRSVAVGLGQFFDEMYPAGTAPASKTLPPAPAPRPATPR
jgi:phospholipid/cholesterol/gamma-HCH transport system substrate-binding protein